MKQNPRKAFLSQRAGAERRGIPFRLTFDEWWSLWGPHYDRAEHLEMCRTEDNGAYEIGNVRIDTKQANIDDRTFNAIDAAVAGSLIASAIGSLPDRVARLERRALHLALARTNGNATHAAARLGITFRTFRYLMKRHNVTRSGSTSDKNVTSQC